MPENRSCVAPTVVRLPQYTKADQGLPKEEHFGIRREDRLVAHAGLLRLPVAIGGAETEVVGVGGVADKDVLVEQPEGRLVTMPLPTMVTPLRDGARWPAGPVRLFSLRM